MEGSLSNGSIGPNPVISSISSSIKLPNSPALTGSRSSST